VQCENGCPLWLKKRHCTVIGTWPLYRKNRTSEILIVGVHVLAEPGGIPLLQAMYDVGYLPQNTPSAKRPNSVQQFALMLRNSRMDVTSGRIERPFAHFDLDLDIHIGTRRRNPHLNPPRNQRLETGRGRSSYAGRPLFQFSERYRVWPLFLSASLSSVAFQGPRRFA